MPVFFTPPPPIVPVYHQYDIGRETPFQREVQRVQDFLNGGYWARITEEERDEYRRIMQRLQEQAGQPLVPDIVLKSPGANSFVSWSPNGLLTTENAKNKAYGYFHFDTQLIYTFTINSPQQHSVQSSGIHIKNGQNAQYTYVIPQDNIHIRRNEVLSSTELDEAFEFINKSNTEKMLSITVGSAFQDIFQVRSHEPIKAPDLTIQKKESPNTNTVELIALKQNPEKPELKWNPIHLDIQSSFPMSQFKSQRVPASGTDDEHFMLTWNVKIPPHSKVQEDMRFHPYNSFYSFLDTDKTPITNLTLPDIQIQTDASAEGQQMRHLNTMFKNARQDLSMLALKIPSKDRTQLYLVPSAGIPNYVAFFGRDSIITSLFLLPFQPEYARQTLLALAEYQGDRYSSVTEEEPGKILHELRYGEMTRLGYTPHRPYYGSLDATPLFIILYQAYLDRTDDAVLAEQLKPHVKLALQWLQVHTETKSGFIKQRYLEQQSVGATGLKNIGWKDSDHALRLILGADNKLHDPAYPVAVAEIQAYVYKAWLSGAKLFPQERSTYLQYAEQLKENFNCNFWLSAQQWPAIAIDKDNQAIPAIASNGAQVLLSDLLFPEQLLGMELRLQKPDLLSGWGIRTLSAQEPAYNPIAYHNGSIWPHDNALIALGAREHHLLSTVQKISDQVLSAARTFLGNRLPELYAGLPKMPGRQTIVPYPDTCIPQAWASASSYGFLTALLGISVSPEGINSTEPLLPTGVTGLQIDRIPISSAHFMDIRARRNASGKVDLWFRESSSLLWQPLISPVSKAHEPSSTDISMRFQMEKLAQAVTTQG